MEEVRKHEYKLEIEQEDDLIRCRLSNPFTGEIREWEGPRKRALALMMRIVRDDLITQEEIDADITRHVFKEEERDAMHDARWHAKKCIQFSRYGLDTFKRHAKPHLKACGEAMNKSIDMRSQWVSAEEIENREVSGYAAHAINWYARAQVAYEAAFGKEDTNETTDVVQR